MKGFKWPTKELKIRVNNQNMTIDESIHCKIFEASLQNGQAKKTKEYKFKDGR